MLEAWVLRRMLQCATLETDRVFSTKCHFTGVWRFAVAGQTSPGPNFTSLTERYVVHAILITIQYIGLDLDSRLLHMQHYIT